MLNYYFLIKMFNMNPMMGNMNMNQMGMSNQLMTNLVMDETAMKIRAIVEPYEKKIIELEKIVRQKDFEITVLKEKLSKSKNNEMNMDSNQMGMINPMNMNNMNNIMNMNMNMMNPMMMNNQVNWMNNYNIENNNNINLGIFNNNKNNINQGINPKLNVIFIYENKEYKELFNIEEKTKTVIKRFCKRVGINNYREKNFFFNDKRINLDLTFSENGIINNSKILVVNPEIHGIDNVSNKTSSKLKYNIGFSNTSGLKINIIESSETSICTVIKKYFIRIGKIDDLIELLYDKHYISFLYNGQKININDKTEVKDYFRLDTHPKIFVYDTQNLIGV